MAKLKTPNLLELPDCISLTDLGKCKRLNIPICQGQNCPFKMTTEELIESKKLSFRIISDLDESLQSHISMKYYNGSMPWK